MFLQYSLLKPNDIFSEGTGYLKPLRYLKSLTHTAANTTPPLEIEDVDNDEASEDEVDKVDEEEVEMTPSGVEGPSRRKWKRRSAYSNYEFGGCAPLLLYDTVCSIPRSTGAEHRDLRRGVTVKGHLSLSTCRCLPWSR